MATQLIPEFLSKAISETAWDFGNQVLYDMCRANPQHKEDRIIIGKIWLIGRSYAAAIERRWQTVGPEGNRILAPGPL